MKRIIIPLVLLAVSMSACGNKQASEVSSQVAKDPQTQKAMQKAQKRVATCAQSNKVYTKTGRQAFVACVAPPAHRKAVVACVQKQFASAKLYRKAGRHKFLRQDIPQCLVNNS